MGGGRLGGIGGVEAAVDQRGASWIAVDATLRATNEGANLFVSAKAA